MYACVWLATTGSALAIEGEWRAGVVILAAFASEALTASHYGKAMTIAGLLAAFAVLFVGLTAGLAVAATSALIGDGLLRRRPPTLVLWNLALSGAMVTAGASAGGAVHGIELPDVAQISVPGLWLAILAGWLLAQHRGGANPMSLLPGVFAVTVVFAGLSSGRWDGLLNAESEAWKAAALAGMRFAGAFMLVDLVAASARARLQAGSVGTAFWREHLPLLFFRYNALIIAGALLAHWATLEGDAVLVLILGALLLGQTAYRAYERAGWTAEAAIAALGEAIDARDPYTAGHSLRVADYAGRFATFLGWSRGRVDRLRRAALMHDVGKIGVPDAVLFKPGKLDPGEFEQMKRHAPIGESIVSRIPGLEGIARIAGEDHERWAGGGYPRGLQGEEIMPEARLLAIVDVFDAMTTDRPYRAGLTEEEALIHLESVAGDQLDPEMTKHFVEHVRAGRASGVLFCYCATH